MNFFALVSGGKDSIYNIITCIKRGHKLIAIGHLYPSTQTELDSYMYQTVGSEIINGIAECLGVPLILGTITKVPVNKEMVYKETENDEVEDMYQLIKTAKEKYPEIQAVSSGAIFSTYQKNRVENVCERLGLVSLAFLWQREQNELLTEMINNHMNSVLIKVCCIGLDKGDILKSLKEMKPKLDKLYKQYQMNVCGEGGEYETVTLDCDIYKKRIIVDDYEIITHSQDPICGVYYAIIKKFHLEDKINN